VKPQLDEDEKESVEEDTEMLKRITTEFGAAVRLILAENLNVLRTFIRDLTSLFGRFSQLQRDAKLRGGKDLV
jgi:hypothetical protein